MSNINHTVQTGRGHSHGGGLSVERVRGHAAAGTQRLHNPPSRSEVGDEGKRLMACTIRSGGRKQNAWENGRVCRCGSSAS